MKVRLDPFDKHTVGIGVFNPSKVGDNRASILEGGKLALLVNLPNTTSDSVHDAAPQRDMIAVEPEAHEIQRLDIQFADLPISFQPQPILSELVCDLTTDAVKFLLVPAKNHHVIHVAQVILRMKLLFDIVVNIRDKEVCEHLRKQHTNRQAVTLMQNHADEVEQPAVFESMFEFHHEAVWLNGWIELRHIHLQVILSVLAVVLYPAFHVFLPVVDTPVWNAAAGKLIHAHVNPFFDGKVNAPMDHLIWIETRLENIALLVARAVNDPLGLIFAGAKPFFNQNFL